MSHLHIFLCCILIGFASIDLLFDSIIFKEYNNITIENIKQIQFYYSRTRSTIIVNIITIFIILIFISLLRCLILRNKLKDKITLLLFLLFLPYYIFIMEPVEDNCIKNINENNNLNKDEIIISLLKVGIGHVIIVIIASIVVLLDLEWKIEPEVKKKEEKQQDENKKLK